MHTSFNISFLGGVYGLYLLSGYYIGKGYIKKLPTCFIIIGAVVCFVSCILLQVYANQSYYLYNVWYDFCGIFITGFLCFELIRRIRFIYEFKFFILLCRYISQISLALFFLHQPLQIALTKYINQLCLWSGFKVILLWGASLLGCVFLIGVFGKVKFVKKYCFLIK